MNACFQCKESVEATHKAHTVILKNSTKKVAVVEYADNIKQKI